MYIFATRHLNHYNIHFLSPFNLSSNRSNFQSSKVPAGTSSQRSNYANAKKNKKIRGLISHWCNHTNQDAACRPQVRTRTSSRCLSTRCSCPATHGTRVDVRSSTSQQCRQPCDEKQRLLAKLIFWIVVCINHICAQTAQHRKASLSSEE